MCPFFLRLLLFFRILKASTLSRASLRCNDKGFHSLTRASYLFLISQENVTEKKATPERRTTGILPCVFVLGSRWSLIAHPCGLTACDRDSRSTSLRGPDESCAYPARRTGSKNLKQKQRKRRPGPPKENPTSGCPLHQTLQAACRSTKAIRNPLRIRKALAAKLAITVNGSVL